MQLLKDHHARELLTLYDAARVVCEGLDALCCVMMNVRRPDLSFTPQTLSIRFCCCAHACIMSLLALIITAALEVLWHVNPI
jgi:hypothetical protein